MEKVQKETGMKLLWTYMVLGCLTVAMFACRDDKFSSSASDTLAFSQDTVRFDTVFTAVGSVTKTVMVYNRHDEHLRISSIRLNGGVNSPFRINVDGVSQTEFSNVEVWRNDSLYLFVEVTVDPNDETMPFLIRDTVSFVTNTVRQQIVLEAYGQNAVVLRNCTIDEDRQLTNEKPYLVYGTCVVSEGCKLTVSPGCRLYFHKDAGIDVHGTLQVEGTPESPVVFRGDRLDKFLKDYKYDDLPGQWNGIRLLSGGAHHIKNAVIRNGKTALTVRSETDDRPQLLIENAKIANFDGCGVKATMADVTIVNSLLADCKRHALSQTGGKLTVEQTTIANYFVNLASTEIRTGASVNLSNSDYDENYQLVNCPLEKADFVNCIVYGSYNDEISLKKTEDETVAFNCHFASSLLKTVVNPEDGRFSQVTDDDPAFVSVKFPHDYHLNENSAARDADVANVAVAQKYQYDLDGNDRLQDGKPDLGAYEYVLKESNEE